MSRNPTRRTRSDSRTISVIPAELGEHDRKIEGTLRRGVYLVPATITSIGLLAGFYSIVSAANGHFELAATLVFLAFVCDGLDGRIARASRTSSQFGVEYDSLSDVIAFGVAPAMLAYAWALKPIGGIGIGISALFVICAALRLARFNVQTADKRRFVGLPVPGAAIMIAGLALAYSYFELGSPRALCTLMVPIVLALAGLMISRVPYPSFKTIKLDKRAQVELVLMIIVFAALLFAMPQLTAFLLATAYVLSGPALLLKGEQLRPKVPVLHPVPPDKPHEANGSTTGNAAKGTRSLRDHQPTEH
jgi:CDP-diacylglycerol--serine O-phosphatidyltransferase